MLENDNMEAVNKGKFSHEKIKLQKKKKWRNTNDWHIWKKVPSKG